METTRLIRAVHATPDVAAVPARIYTDVQPFGRYVPADEAVGHVEVSIYGPHPHLTFAHEVGHFLDQFLAAYTGYASAMSYSVLRPVMNAIEQSNAYTQLSQIAHSHGTTLAERVAQQRATYWSGREELWARTYAQYIAVRSGSKQLRADVQLARQLETHAAAAYAQ